MTISADSMAASASQPKFAGASRREQTPRRYPDIKGYIERDRQQLFYELIVEGEKPATCSPPRSLFHSRHCKVQIPYFARPLPGADDGRPRQRSVQLAPRYIGGLTQQRGRTQ